MIDKENALVVADESASEVKNDYSKLYAAAAEHVDMGAFITLDFRSCLSAYLDEIGRIDVGSVERFAAECVLRAYASDYRAVRLDVMADLVRSATRFVVNSMVERHIADKSEMKLAPGAPLSPSTAACLILAHEHVRMICDAEFIGDKARKGVVGAYAYNGASRGTYVEMTPASIKAFAEPSINAITSIKWQDETLEQLTRLVDDETYRVAEVWDPNLVWVDNGIFNLKTKKLEPFSPELPRLVKLGTRYVEDVPDVTRTLRGGTVIRRPDDLFHMYVPYDGGVHLLWQVIRAIAANQKIRKQITLYNASGKNGKSTILDMLAALVGPKASCATSMEALCEGTFNIAPLVGKLACFINDSEAGLYVKNVLPWKEMVSWDLIQAQRKFRDPFTFRPHANFIAAANDIPAVRDKGDAYVDRNIYIPFTGRFDGATEDISVRAEYIVSKPFLEAVLHIALTDVEPFDEFDIPDAVSSLMMEWRESNDPILDFLHSAGMCRENAHFFAPVLPAKDNRNLNGGAPYATEPLTYSLFEKYTAWAERNRPMALKAPPTPKAFAKHVRQLCLSDPMWIYPSKTRPDGKRDAVKVYPHDWVFTYEAGSTRYPAIVRRDLWAIHEATGDVPRTPGQNGNAPAFQPLEK